MSFPNSKQLIVNLLKIESLNISLTIMLFTKKNQTTRRIDQPTSYDWWLIGAVILQCILGLAYPAIPFYQVPQRKFYILKHNSTNPLLLEKPS